MRVCVCVCARKLIDGAAIWLQSRGIDSPGCACRFCCGKATSMQCSKASRSVLSATLSFTLSTALCQNSPATHAITSIIPPFQPVLPSLPLSSHNLQSRSAIGHIYLHFLPVIGFSCFSPAFAWLLWSRSLSSDARRCALAPTVACLKCAGVL